MPEDPKLLEYFDLDAKEAKSGRDCERQRLLFYRIGLAHVNNAGLSKEEFRAQNRTQSEVMRSAMAHGLSFWCSLIAGAAAAAKADGMTEQECLETLVDYILEVEQSVKRGVREATDAGLWPWVEPTDDPETPPPAA